MRVNRITELYEGLSSRELALMAFNRLGEMDPAEINRIADVVPRRTYTGMDSDFREWAQRLTDVAAVWGFTYWRLRCQCLACLVAMYAPSGLAEEASARAAALERKLIAHDNVLVEICEAHGIDPDAVRRYSDAKPYEPLLEADVLEPDADYAATLRSELLGLLPGAEVAVVSG